MSTNPVEMTGAWNITGLPSDYAVTLFETGQLGTEVAGNLVLTSVGPVTYAVLGHNNYPEVKLDFNLNYTETMFSFAGQFADENTITGNLSGEFSGEATISRAGGA